MRLSKVKDHPHLYRDEDTGAILSYDTIGYNQRLSNIERQKSQKEELKDMRKDIDEIKSLLKEFLKNK
jgi:hypothetical protein